MQNLKKVGLASALALGLAMPASAVTLDAEFGDNSFDNGWASKIYYDSTAARGTDSDRDEPANALGENDGEFFEIGFGSTVILTFGTLFTSPGFVIEVTNGSTASWPEFINIFVGNLLDDTWQAVDQNPISNSGAQGAPGFQFTFGGGPFDALKIVDISTFPQNSETGGYDIDAVRISPIPLPAGGVLLLTALGGLAIARRRKQA